MSERGDESIGRTAPDDMSGAADRAERNEVEDAERLVHPGSDRADAAEPSGGGAAMTEASDSTAPGDAVAPAASALADELSKASPAEAAAIVGQAGTAELVGAASELDSALMTGVGRDGAQLSEREQADHASDLVTIRDELQERITAAPLDDSGLPILEGVAWNQDSPLAGAIEDIGPFGNADLWASYAQSSASDDQERPDATDQTDPRDQADRTDPTNPQDQADRTDGLGQADGSDRADGRGQADSSERADGGEQTDDPDRIDRDRTGDRDRTTRPDRADRTNPSEQSWDPYAGYGPQPHPDQTLPAAHDSAGELERGFSNYDAVHRPQEPPVGDHRFDAGSYLERMFGYMDTVRFLVQSDWQPGSDYTTTAGSQNLQHSGNASFQEGVREAIDDWNALTIGQREALVEHQSVCAELMQSLQERFDAANEYVGNRWE